MSAIEAHSDALQRICQEHSVEKLYIFGSAATGTYNAESDVDILVRFKSIYLTKYFINYSDFKEKLQLLFKRKVDLVEEQTLSNPYLIKSIDATKHLIYGLINNSAHIAN